MGGDKTQTIYRGYPQIKSWKFRSMKMSTPHNVPTHMLENPEQYITKAGRFIRQHSFDELPQIWDIFVGNMSAIGPRPILPRLDMADTIVHRINEMLNEDDSVWGE